MAGALCRDNDLPGRVRFSATGGGPPASAVNWGLWKSLADAQTGVERQTTAESGLQPMEDDVAIKALAACTSAQAPVRATIVAADWARLAAAYRTRTALHILDDLLPSMAGVQVSAASTTAFRRELADADPDSRRDMLSAHVAAHVAAAMGLTSPQLLDPAVGFFQFGMDSLMSVTLQRSLSETLGQVLPAAVVFDYPTVDALTDYFASVLPEIIDSAGSEGRRRGVNEDSYDDLGEEELLQRLSERLN